MFLRRARRWCQAVVLTALLVALAACRNEAAGTTAPAGEGALTPEEREELLRLARQTIESYLKDHRIPPYRTDNPHFLRQGGAFVTLKKHGNLRGCIGYIYSNQPLYQTIQQAAVAAATQDPRFPTVRPSEMAEITIEISLLSPLEKVHDVSDIVVGKHGLLIRRGYYQGLLLPQVAPEQGWDREQFLEGVCYKAGLPPDAWKDPSTELYSFTAEIFSEEE
ncbi:MAG: AmmeMemoRadiSam system protein A [Chloroflexia bacterium]